jgi:hypothetical protein
MIYFLKAASGTLNFAPICPIIPQGTLFNFEKIIVKSILQELISALESNPNINFFTLVDYRTDLSIIHPGLEKYSLDITNSELNSLFEEESIESERVKYSLSIKKLYLTEKAFDYFRPPRGTFHCSPADTDDDLLNKIFKF